MEYFTVEIRKENNNPSISDPKCNTDILDFRVSNIFIFYKYSFPS